MIPELHMRPGRVLASGEAMNSYIVELVPMGGQIIASASHGSRGTWGVTESGSYASGQDVWIGTPSSGTVIDAVIICARAVPNSDWFTDSAPSITVGHPDQVGYSYAARLVGSGRASGAMSFVCKAQDWMPRDTLSGEWAQTAPFGSGVGVELFRAWLRGGHMSGVVCNSVDQSTRVYGHKLSTWSVASEDDEFAEGNSTLAIKRSSLYSDKVLDNQPPEKVEIGGGAYGGWHTFIFGASLANKQANLAHLMHGSDGSIIYRSASTLALIRSCSLSFPKELRRASDRDAVAASPVVVSAATTMSADKLDAVITDPRPGLAAADDETDIDGLNTLSYMERIQASIWRAWNGFRNSSENSASRWAFSSGTASGAHGTEGVQDMTSAMWSTRSLFALPFDDSREAESSGASGTAGLIIDKNGDVIIRGSFGEQILLSRGTITQSAPNDILTLPGRNSFTLAGKHAVTKANEHIELESNTGRVSARAHTQLSMSAPGVLVEATSTGYVADIGDGYEQQVEGLILLSMGTAAMLAPDLRMTGVGTGESEISEPDTSLLIDCKRVQIRTAGTTATIENEVIWSTSLSGVPFVLAQDYVVLPAIFTPTVPCVEDTGADEHVSSATEAAVEAASAMANMPQPDAFSPTNLSNFGFKWGTSAQYGTDIDALFKLYEQPWQRFYRVPGAPVPTTWTQRFLSIDGSCSYPGADALIAEDRLAGLAYTDWYDPVSMSYKTDLNELNGSDSGDVTTLPKTDTTAINTNWIIRP